ncbi:phenylalanine--tRNA ligase subunit beta [Candidatus Omnitrophota bacterium]
MRVSLNWLKDFIDVKGGLEKVQNALTMIGLEVSSVINIEDDHIMDIEVTPNRPDCLSILGVARELRAATDRSLKLPASIKKNYMKRGPGRGTAKVEILDKKACPRYVGCIIKNVKVGPSPKWLVDRLNAMGVRSINNIVDITNYVLFETGEPLHAFDLDKLIGKKIIVRKAKKGESIVTIDGVKRELDPSMLVIADVARPIAIAGIMGGKETEITDDTKTIFLESAYFDPITIRRAQRKLGLASESSYRFERGVDFAMVLSASARAQEIIRDVAGGRVKGTITDAGGKIIKGAEIALSLDEIPRVLGVEVSPKSIVSFFKNLDLKPIKRGKKIIVTVPPYRQDLEKEIDLIEEVARLYGYNNLPIKIPTFTAQKTYEEEKKENLLLEKEAKRILYSLGMNEIVTYTLTGRSAMEALGESFENLVRIKNPLSSNQEFMRGSLLSEMLEVMSWNLNRKNTLLKLFELNKVYSLDKEKNQIQERSNLSLSVCGTAPGNWKEKSRELDFFDLKGIVELFLQSLGIKNYTIEKVPVFIFKEAMSACIKIDGAIIGSLGEVKQDVARKFDIKQKVFTAEILLEDLFRQVSLKKRFTALPRYPSVKRDISILVDDAVSSSSIFDVIKEEGKDLVKSIDVFDFYKGQQIEEGKKSLAYSVEYRSGEKTLKDEEIVKIHKDIQETLVKKLGAQIR